MTAMISSGEGQKSKIAVLWHQRGLAGKMSLVISALMVVYHLLFISGGLAHLGIRIMISTHASISLAFMLVIIFLTTPAKKGTARDTLPWYDVVLIFMGIAGAGYFFAFSDLALTHLQLAQSTMTETVLFVLLLIASFEASRRLIGWALPVVALFFISHALFTKYFPGILSGRSFSINRLTLSFYLGDSGIFGIPMIVAATIVAAFIIFAEMLRQSGAADFFLKLAMSLFGHMRGGPAKIAVFASALFATISGTVAGNVAATGSVTIPLMKSTGYQPHFAAAVEAVASKGGQITPPVMGSVAFLMAQMTGIGYLAVCIAAALPALLYFTAVFFQVDFEAAKTGMKGLPREQIPPVKKTIKEGWHYIVPLVALIILLVIIKYEAEMAALYSLVVLGLIMVFRKEARIGPARLLTACEDAAKLICIAGIACAMAGVVIGSLMGTGLGVTFSAQLLYLSGGNLLLLLGLTAIACYVLGMGMSSIAIYVILAIMVAPALVKMGVPLEAAHLFVIYWGNVAFITPPVCVAAYVAASIANASPMRTGWQAVRLAIVTFIVPFIFVYEPALIMIGEPAQIALATITSIGGVIVLAAGLEGYFFQPANWLERSALLIGGLLLVFPGWVTDLIGIGLVSPVMVRQLLAAQSARRAAATGSKTAANPD